jgi:hypothetical protein
MTMDTTIMDTTGAKFPKQRATTPRSQIKSVYWRGNVIEVVNRFFNYVLVPPLEDPRWTKSWRVSIDRSIAQINAGQGKVHTSTKSFLDALDES